MAGLKTLPDELPLETDEYQMDRYLLDLVDLTTERICERANAIVPPEAVDYIGRERSAMNEKIHVISELGFQMRNCFAKSLDREKLNESIRTLVSASSNPAQSMAIISRMWKHLAYNGNIPFKPKWNFMESPCFYPVLADYARQQNLSPLSVAEDSELCFDIRTWKDGTSPERILKKLDAEIRKTEQADATAERALNTPARRQRRHRSRMREHMVSRVYIKRLLEIRAFLEKLFQKKDQVSDHR